MVKKEDIFNAAINLFLKKGYSNVTIMDICNQLNITKPTFYKHVNGKEDLILNLYDYIINNITSDTIKVIEADSNVERLVVIFSELMDQTLAYNSDLYSQMLIANLNQNRHSFDLRNKMTDLCVLLIQKAQKYKEIKNTKDAKFLYQTIAYCFTGYETMWCINDGKIDIKREFFKSMQVILDVEDEYLACFDKYVK